MKDTEIEFDADDFIGAVEVVRDHVKGKRKITMRTSKFALPKKPAPMSPKQIIALRQTLKMSQPVFARMLNVGSTTAASWERGSRKPSGPALKILRVAQKHPEVLMEPQENDALVEKA
ncbi:helix-turn-helix domain-containing protein [Puniceicoccus vermicola]|uniref:Type II toxin-antitoxin system MqsA family antitoxin n=1 Tax=Puniceicoccus vermicola TaxID=388746 RepID=A0A7X1AVF1_9BACT|nr:type II toxin-antitoxin system MqsA family antitoxin [Puniceicoccus vermicola]MBC2600527.1 type II toxin-antitoxin system MqsA family antitoxin [Puniceicoccus vermicola]